MFPTFETRTIPIVRALARVRPLLPVVLAPVCIAALGFGVQAAAFRRPARGELLSADAMRELTHYNVMQSVEDVAGRHMSSVCLQGWFHAPQHRRLIRGALVLLGNGERLYDFGGGVRAVGRSGPANPLDRARFVLAGCPRFLDDRIGRRLLRGQAVGTYPARADGAAALAIALGRGPSTLVLDVQRRTYEPVELALVARDLRGSSDLEPGDGKAAVTQVRRAFHLDRTGRRHL